ncbi:MAG TPA: aminopeptidase [Candidatus Bathyarchaeia archaeon]|nr:aminopeptidase [Candidatus Bathyarchaeia archaeon]
MPDYEGVARQILDVCINVKPDENVWINTWNSDLELGSVLASESSKRGCQVLSTVQYEENWLHSISDSSVETADVLPTRLAGALKDTDAYIFTVGPRIIPWDKIPADRRHLVTRWFNENNNFVREWKAIAKARKVRMLGVEATLASKERADQLGLDYDEWKKVMFEGCLADHIEISRHASNLSGPLAGDGRVRITSPHGTDFTFRLDRRQVDSFDGILRDEWVSIGRPGFLPAGGIEVSTNEESGQGTVVFDKPILSLLREGRIEKLSLKIRQGRIVDSAAGIQQGAFKKWLVAGSGDSDRLGFFGFGLNHKLKHGFTQDDKTLGGVTLGFGDNRDKAGKNRSERGFWASMTGATVSIDDFVIMKHGRLLV